MAEEMQQVACLGAGRMGRGIAHCAAFSGHHIKLLDVKRRSLDEFTKLKAECLSEIENGLRMIAQLGGFDGDVIPQLMQRISVVPRDQSEAALADAALVFEAVPEVVEVKRDAFALFDAHAAADAILASTTSTILST